MNKKYMASFALLLMVGVVSAAYLINSFVVTADVDEPFSVEYAMVSGLEPGNNPDVVCQNYNGTWSPAGDMDIGSVYPGEAVVACANITNFGAGELGYDFKSIPHDENNTECSAAFPPTSSQDGIAGLSTTAVGFEFVVAGDAGPLTDCQVDVSLSRE